MVYSGVIHILWIKIVKKWITLWIYPFLEQSTSTGKNISLNPVFILCSTDYHISPNFNNNLIHIIHKNCVYTH
jgi:hypothetical protein